VDYLFDANASLANQIIEGVESVYMQVEELRAFALKLESHEVMVSLGTIVDSLSRIGDLGSNIQYFTNWIRKSSSFIPISKYFTVKCLKS